MQHFLLTNKLNEKLDMQVIRINVKRTEHRQSSSIITKIHQKNKVISDYISETMRFK